MNLPFADTCFWIALMSSKDALHNQALSLNQKYTKIITSQEVLSEFMNFFCGRGNELRKIAVRLVKKIENNKTIEILEQTSQSFNWGMDLYAKRVDKEYSFIDCISMATMREMGISLALTNDHHFSQEGFQVLMK